MKYKLNDTWINDDTITELPVGALQLSDKEWNDRQNIPYQPTQLELDARHNAKVDAELKEADIDNIRILLEWAATQADAPQLLIDREAVATAKRLTRK